jgi:SNF2 family DNA or RNA helicase
VHKFVCRGTVEEKIDELIESKRRLSTDLLEGGAELLLTELKAATDKTPCRPTNRGNAGL